MGWLGLVGSLKLQVSYVEYRLFYRALLQKRPIILRSLLIVATPYARVVSRMCDITCVGHECVTTRAYTTLLHACTTYVVQ